MNLRKVKMQRSTQDSMSTNDTEQYKIEVNYEFLDDYHDDTPFWQKYVCPRSEHHIYDDFNNGADANFMDEMEKSKGFAAKWGPKKFSRRKHPLALMVSWFD